MRRPNPLLALFCVCLLPFIAGAQVDLSNLTASFTGPDSVCSGTPVKFTNTSSGASNYLWSFCSGFKNNPSSTDLSIINNTLNLPVFIDYALDTNGNYYGIVTNHLVGKITRLNFGKSLLNKPTAQDLGDFNGALPEQLEGVQIEHVNGRWYAIAVGGGNQNPNSSPRIVKLDFGNSLANTPVATNWGNIGNLNLPIDFQIIQENGNYYGFTMNVFSNTITRFDFGNDFINAPKGTNLGNIGNLDYPDGFTFIKNNNNWYAFAANSNSSVITRLDFGSSVTNTPTAIAIGNPGNLLGKPRDITFLFTCNGIFGYVLNSTDDRVIKLNFGSDITSIPTATDLGSFNNSFPHSFSDFFTDGNDIFTFVPNVNSNTIARFKFAGCQTIPGSTKQNPDTVSYKDPGTYTVNLMVDIGLPTQTSFCKQLIVNDCTPQVKTIFTGPDSVCAGTPVKFINTSSGASNYLWSFCSDFKTNPSSSDVNIVNNTLNLPVFIDYGLDSNGNYYGLVTNHLVGRITRLNFGNSLLNTPTAQDLGDFNGALPTQLEGVQIEHVNGRWYAIVVGGGNEHPNSSPRIVKLDFGNSLANTPIVTNWGNIGNLDLPIDFYIAEEGGNYYGFTMNVTSNTITRFDFGNDFVNPPAGVNLGNIGNLDYPDGFTFIKKNTDWYALAVNTFSNSITRLKFGSSLTNIPTADVIANPGNLFSKPRDISILSTCNGIFGYVVNANDNKLIKLDFGSDITSTPTATDLGSFNYSFPHSFSDFFSVGSDIYTFIPNVNSNSIARLKFAGCQTIPGSTKQNPDSIIYTNPGNYTIALITDLGLPTQGSFCKQILVQDCNNPCDSFKVNAGKDVSVCYGNSVQLNATGASTYNWNASTKLNDTTIANPLVNTLTIDSFIVVGKNSSGTCSDTDTVKVTVLPLPVFSVSNDTSICRGNAVQLKTTATNDYNYHWSPPNYLSDTAIANPVSTPLDSIKYFVTAIDSFNCRSTDSIQINSVQPPVIATIANASICVGDSVTLSTTITNANSYKWSPPEGLIDAFVISPVAVPTKTTRYIISAINSICATTDSVLITVYSLPDTYAGNDTTTCGNGAAQLIASGAATYNWQPSTGLSDTSIANPVASPVITTTYYVIGTSSNGCVRSDSIVVTKVPDPVFAIVESDSLICSGETLLLTASGGDVYTWSPAQSVSNPSAPGTTSHPVTATNYSVTIYNTTCKVSDTLSTSVKVNTSPKITISKSNDLDCSQPDAQLNATGGLSYVWQPDTFINNNTIPNPQVSPPSDTWYAVTATASNSCTTTDSVLVKSSIDKAGFLVASGFTPNGDGLNDCIGVKYWGIPASFNMMIYDKWGMPVYASKNIDECWDGSYKGKKQGSGTYVYFITATNVCGRDKIFRKGTIVLIR